MDIWAYDIWDILAENREIALVFSGDIAKLGDIAPLYVLL